jgi:catalase
VLFDAVAIVLAEPAAERLSNDAAAVQFAMDAYGHLKAIGHDAGAAILLARAGVDPDAGVTDLSDAFFAAARTRHYDRETRVRDLA